MAPAAPRWLTASVSAATVDQVGRLINGLGARTCPAWADGITPDGVPSFEAWARPEGPECTSRGRGTHPSPVPWLRLRYPHSKWGLAATTRPTRHSRSGGRRPARLRPDAHAEGAGPHGMGRPTTVLVVVSITVTLLLATLAT